LYYKIWFYSIELDDESLGRECLLVDRSVHRE
jgi:hypothetical protein